MTTVCGMTSADSLHAAVADAFNRSDLDGLVALYDEGACMVAPDGTFARGHDEIRKTWAESLAMNGTIAMTTRYCIEQGDVALLSNAWRFSAGDVTFDAVSAEVAVRGAEGKWLYIVDHPTGGS